MVQFAAVRAGWIRRFLRTFDKVVLISLSDFSGIVLFAAVDAQFVFQDEARPTPRARTWPSLMAFPNA